ncbi:MAG: DUF2069 domain-containing protein [Limnohabitans sp.]
MTPSSTAFRHARLTRFMAVGSLLGLIVLSLAWELWLAPLRPGGSWLVLKALPLCLPLAGLLKNRMYTYRWVTLVVWLYFAEGVIRWNGDRWPSNFYAGVEVVLCLVLFAASAMHVRWRLKDAALASQTAAQSSSDSPDAQEPKAP